jgi:hypothetical protein
LKSNLPQTFELIYPWAIALLSNDPYFAYGF